MNNKQMVSFVSVVVSITIIISLILVWGMLEGQWGKQEFLAAVEAGYIQEIHEYVTEQKTGTRVRWVKK